MTYPRPLWHWTIAKQYLVIVAIGVGLQALVVVAYWISRLLIWCGLL